jgi:hypothetical protein
MVAVLELLDKETMVVQETLIMLHITLAVVVVVQAQLVLEH